MPLWVSMECGKTSERVEFWNKHIDASMQASANTARRIARQYLLDEYGKHVPEKLFVQCCFPRDDVSFKDTSASLLIGISIVEEVLGVKSKPATVVTGEIGESGEILRVGFINEKIEAASKHKGIERMIIPEANVLEISPPPLVRAVQFSVESTFRGGLHVPGISRIAQMEATSESGLHQKFRELNSPAPLVGNAVDLRSSLKKIPPNPPLRKGGKERVPPFSKGGLGGILTEQQRSSQLTSTTLPLVEGVRGGGSESSVPFSPPPNLPHPFDMAQDRQGGGMTVIPIRTFDEAVQQVLDLHWEDWGEAPGLDVFYGRQEELDEIHYWIFDERCHLVAILGMGGIGKTTLTRKLTKQVKNQFQYLFWRDLRNAPPVENLLSDCIKFLSHQQQITLPEDVDNRLGDTPTIQLTETGFSCPRHLFSGERS